jgi:choline dehydrogenase-like flavoprotein
MKKAIVVGTGAGGATIARELQGKFDVLILEAGREFRPFSHDLRYVVRMKQIGLLFDAREIQLLFPTMRVHKTSDGMLIVNGIGLGGTTTISAGNALRMDKDLKNLGINLDAEFEELYREIPITEDHQKRWNKTTRLLFEACVGMGLHPRPIPKMGHYERCISCGRCLLGCAHGVKWDSREFLKAAVDKGAQLMTKCIVEQFIIENGMAVEIRSRSGFRHVTHQADLVILASGGLGTPMILGNSGISCEPALFVDPVLCVAAIHEASFQDEEIPMPFVVQQDGFIISPYFDYLSYFFNKRWNPPAKNILSLMIKLADTNSGMVREGMVDKKLTEQDEMKLSKAIDISKEILQRLGATKERIFLGILNAGHPGGMLPLTVNEAISLHHDRLPQNLYVADASLLPRAPGNPPMLTIMALAKRIAKICCEKMARP